MNYSGYAQAKGTSPQWTYDLIRDVKEPNRQSLWAEDARSAFRLNRWRIVALKPLDVSVFSKSELESLDWAIATYGSMTMQQLIDETKKEKLYREADLTGEISVESMARSLPRR